MSSEYTPSRPMPSRPMPSPRRRSSIAPRASIVGPIAVRVTVVCLLVACLLPGLLVAQGDDDGTWGGNAPEPRVAGDVIATQGEGPPQEACDGGVIFDDGSTEIAYGWVPTVDRGRYVQEFHSGQFSTTDLESVCVCFRRSAGSGNDDSLDFRVVIYDSVAAPGDGDAPEQRAPANEPRVSIAASGSGVPIGTNGEFFEVPMQGARLPTGTFYLGVEWDARTDRFFFLCSDSSPGTEPVEAFFREDLFDAWSSVYKSNDGIFQDYKALMIRAVPNSEEAVDVPSLGHLGGWVLVGLLATFGLVGLRRRWRDIGT